ncbi:GNAT family N-acetyltransferase [Ideonella azotifigens]|uniref:GNAT family N-acetyltransferase n=1 Tax=Ideonella azotifigens TaxID=513160 RepID=UPI001E38E643|nr:GNAT family N-acetyltransferase [Ideonella azotifigens]MCD2339646.1 GNAT family N-acetyltransferase [Ideonella azotifigens]
MPAPQDLTPPAIRFQRYTAADAARWNATVAASPTQSFLFDRGYMEYHAERFDEHSLLAWQGETLLALLPAHRVGERLVSHGGLSYGGWLLARPLGAAKVLALMQALQRWLPSQGISSLLYKTLPHIYQRQPSEADRYALFRCGAERVRCDVMSAIGPTAAHWPKAQRRQITQAMRQRPELSFDALRGGEGTGWTEFWAVLQAELQARHASRPTHNEAELRLLASRFPAEISLQLARWSGVVCAGLVMFETATVCHLQYMAADAQSRRCAALDQLVERAIVHAQTRGKWFDFGHSNEDGGWVLNEGLAFYKESFGATAVVHEHYLLTCPAPPETHNGD